MARINCPVGKTLEQIYTPEGRWKYKKWRKIESKKLPEWQRGQSEVQVIDIKAVTI